MPGLFMQRKPNLADQISPCLRNRLHDNVRNGGKLLDLSPVLQSLLLTYQPWRVCGDQEWEIRAKAVKEVLQIAVKSLELVSSELVKMVGDR